MSEDEIKQTADLPFGYRVTFVWRNGGLANVEWRPAVPCIKSPRAQRKFRDAYNIVRRDFLEGVATQIGGDVLVADIDGPMEVVRPATKH